MAYRASLDNRVAQSKDTEQRSGSMSEEIRFETVTIKGDTPGRDRDGVAVIRGGRQVAVLPEADRLNRALGQPLEEIEYIAKNLRELLEREPTRDEREFWRAVLDLRRSLEGQQVSTRGGAHL